MKEDAVTGFAIYWCFTGFVSTMFYVGRWLKMQPETVGWPVMATQVSRGLVVIAAIYAVVQSPERLFVLP